MSFFLLHLLFLPHSPSLIQSFYPSSLCLILSSSPSLSPLFSFPHPIFLPHLSVSFFLLHLLFLPHSPSLIQSFSPSSLCLILSSSPSLSPSFSFPHLIFLSLISLSHSFFFTFSFSLILLPSSNLSLPHLSVSFFLLHLLFLPHSPSLIQSFSPSSLSLILSSSPSLSPLFSFPYPIFLPPLCLILSSSPSLSPSFSFPHPIFLSLISLSHSLFLNNSFSLPHFLSFIHSFSLLPTHFPSGCLTWCNGYQIQLADHEYRVRVLPYPSYIRSCVTTSRSTGFPFDALYKQTPVSSGGCSFNPNFRWNNEPLT